MCMVLIWYRPRSHQRKLKPRPHSNPVPELEESEFIECFTVPLATLYEETKRLEQEGFGIDARVGTLAEAVELGKKYRF